MNHESDSAKRHLELATASAQADAALDAETTELREGWAALAHAQRQQDARFEAAAFAQRLTAELTAIPPTARARRPMSIAWRLVAGAIAASLLAVVTWWMAQPARERDQVAKVVQEQPAVASHSAAASIDSAIAWDDPLDSRILQVQEQMSQFGAAARLDASLSSLDQRMAELASDLDEGSL